ncbi:MAG TPA: hypothetical protein VMZ53_13660 [Kofleriaceae bacterium]|nr:hypothetical protein [Kofleriaceae bacterium]
MPMKSTTVIVAVALVALSIAACFVHRPSDELVCSSDADCMDGRKCTSGYCVVPQCPSDCDGCDEAGKSCTMNCSSNDDCNSVNCPSGWTCIINCIGDGACDDVSCSSGSHCTITCTGDGACNDISCRDACECDLLCSGTACDAISCPQTSGGIKCTTDGTIGSPCLSTAAGCTKC